MMYKFPSKSRSFTPDKPDSPLPQRGISPSRSSFSSSVAKSNSPRPLFPVASGMLPMSPAAFPVTACTSASLSVIEPKAQKPIQSACKKIENLSSSSSLGLQNRTCLNASPSETQSRFGRDACGSWYGVEKQLAKEEDTAGHRATSEDLSLTDAFMRPSASDGEQMHPKTMEKQKYITIDPWSSRATLGNDSFAGNSRNGAESTTANGFVRTSTQPTERPSAAPAMPLVSAWSSGQNEMSRALTFDQRGLAKPDVFGGSWRGYGSGGSGATASDGECTYTARPSHDSCSTSASYQLYGPQRSDDGGTKSWGRLRLSDGSQYASTYFGKSWSGVTPSTAPPIEAAAREGARIHSSSTGVNGETIYRISKASLPPSAYSRANSSVCHPVPPVFPASVQYPPQPPPSDVFTAPATQTVHGLPPPPLRSQPHPNLRYFSTASQETLPIPNTVQDASRGAPSRVPDGDVSLRTETMLTSEQSPSSVYPPVLSVQHRGGGSLVRNLPSDADHLLTTSDSSCIRAASCSSSQSLSSTTMTGNVQVLARGRSEEIPPLAPVRNQNLPPLPPSCHFPSSFSSGIRTGDPRRHLTPPVPPRRESVGILAAGERNICMSSALAEGTMMQRQIYPGEEGLHPRRASLPANAQGGRNLTGGVPIVPTSSFYSSTYTRPLPSSSLPDCGNQNTQLPQGQRQQVLMGSSDFIPPFQFSCGQDPPRVVQSLSENNTDSRFRGLSAPRNFPCASTVSQHEGISNSASITSLPQAFLPRPSLTCSTPPLPQPPPAPAIVPLPVTEVSSRKPLSVLQTGNVGGDSAISSSSSVSTMKRSSSSHGEGCFEKENNMMIYQRGKTNQALLSGTQRSRSLSGLNHISGGVLGEAALDERWRSGVWSSSSLERQTPESDSLHRSKRGAASCEGHTHTLTDTSSYRPSFISLVAEGRGGRSRCQSEDIRNDMQSHAGKTSFPRETLPKRKERELNFSNNSKSQPHKKDDVTLDHSTHGENQNNEGISSKRHQTESSVLLLPYNSSSLIHTQHQAEVYPPSQVPPFQPREEGSRSNSKPLNPLQIFLDEAAAAIGYMCGSQGGDQQKMKTTRKAEKTNGRRRHSSTQEQVTPETSGLVGSYENLTSFSSGGHILHPTSYDGHSMITHSDLPGPSSSSTIPKTARRLPASPIAPIDFSCVSVDPAKDCRPAVTLSPIRSSSSSSFSNAPYVSCEISPPSSAPPSVPPPATTTTSGSSSTPAKSRVTRKRREEEWSGLESTLIRSSHGHSPSLPEASTSPMPSVVPRASSTSPRFDRDYRSLGGRRRSSSSGLDPPSDKGGLVASVSLPARNGDLEKGKREIGKRSLERLISQTPADCPPPPEEDQQQVLASQVASSSCFEAKHVNLGISVDTMLGEKKGLKITRDKDFSFSSSSERSQQDVSEEESREEGEDLKIGRSSMMVPTRRGGAGEEEQRGNGSFLSLTVHLLCGVTGRRMRFVPSGSVTSLPFSSLSSSFSPLSHHPTLPATASASLGFFPSSFDLSNGGSGPLIHKNTDGGLSAAGGPSISSLLLEKAFSRAVTRRRLLNRPLQLIHVNRWDGREVLTVDEQARKYLSELGSQHIAVISICGAAQTGKSSFANLLLDETHMLTPTGFAVGSPPGSLGGAFGYPRVPPPGTTRDRDPKATTPHVGRGESTFYDEGGQPEGTIGGDSYTVSMTENFPHNQSGGSPSTSLPRFEQRVLSDGCTEGVWMQAVSLSGGGSNETHANGRGGGEGDFIYLVLDFEGVGCTRKTVEHDQRLFTLAMLISHYLVYNTRGVLDADAISGMASVSTWTQRLLRSEGTGGGPLNIGGNGSISPSLRDDTGGSHGLSPVHGSSVGPGGGASGGPRVPSGWRAPSLLWLLQDFNWTLTDENENSLTESDYLEAVLGTASHVSPCCLESSLLSSSPPSSRKSISFAHYHRICMELNQPQIRMQRQQIAELFEERVCVGLPHPLGFVSTTDPGIGGMGGDPYDESYKSMNHEMLKKSSTQDRLSMVTTGKDRHYHSNIDSLKEEDEQQRDLNRIRRTSSSSQFSFFESHPGLPHEAPSFSSSSSSFQAPLHSPHVLYRPVETAPVTEFHAVYRRRLQQAKATIFKECRLRAAEGVAITGPGFVKILQKIIDGINGGEVPESRTVVNAVQREECRKWKEKCEHTFMHDLRETFQSRLPMSNRELQDGALALQKRALSQFKLHVIGDDDVVRRYKQQLKDRLRKITDRAIEENERHGEWKARCRLRTLMENLQIETKLKDQLYSSMAEVTEDVETLKKEFNSDCRGPSHVSHKILTEQVDQILAKGSSAICEILLDQSRETQRTVQELQQRAQQAEQTVEKTLQLEQQLQSRDYETEELRRELEEQRATNHRLNTMVAARGRTGVHPIADDDDDDLDSRLSGLHFGRHRTPGRSRIGVHDQNRCFGQKRCTIM